MNQRKYFKCIGEIFFTTFKDARLRLNFFSSLLLLGVGIFANILIPILLKRIVELFSSPSNVTLSLILLSYGVIWMISQSSTHLRALLTHRIEQRINYILGIKVISHLYSLPQSYFLNQKPGALTNIIRRAQQHVPSIVIGIFFHVLPIVIEFLVAIILISSLYSSLYSSLIAVTLVIFVIYTFYSMHVVLKHREHANEIDKNADGVIADWIANYEAIKVFGNHDLAIKTCKKELKKRESAEISFVTKFNIVHLGQTLILGIGLTALTYFVGQGVVRGELTTGDFVLFNGYVLQFIIPMSVLGLVTQEIKKALVDMKGIMELLLTESNVKEISCPIHLSGSRFQIHFKNVSFKYNENHIFDNVSFKINTGETVLIVGQTGIGKSTIAKLLLRLYDPTKGQIFINQVNIKQLSFQSLYETVGLVPQEAYLLNDTVKNNLLFAKPEASSLEIESALDNAMLLGFVNKLPQGINTIVGDRGLKLSGGEKQRLSLARIFLKKPKICIFDESTAALDENTGLIIQNNIEANLREMTKIIITHRPSLIHKANAVIHLDKMFTYSKIPSNSLQMKVPHFNFKNRENHAYSTF